MALRCEAGFRRVGRAEGVGDDVIEQLQIELRWIRGESVIEQLQIELMNEYAAPAA